MFTWCSDTCWTGGFTTGAVPSEKLSEELNMLQQSSQSPKSSSDWLLRSLAHADKCPPLRDLPTNSQQPSPRRDPSQTSSEASSSSAFAAPSPPPSRPVSALCSEAASKAAPSHTTLGSASSRPVPAPRTSATAAKTLQSKIHFFQSDDTNHDNETGRVQHAAAGQTVSIVVNAGGKDASLVEEKPKASGVGGGSGKVSESPSESSRAKAAALLSRKLAEENNNKPSWTNVVLKKTDK